MTMRYDAILLDMDGTVLNTIEDLADAMNAALRHFGMPERSLAEVRAFVGNGAKRLVEQAVPAGTDEARRDFEGVRISNKPDPAVALLAQEHFAGLLDLAVGETARLRRKPWPDMVEEACARLGLRKERCLYVGDSEVDVLTARNAGLDCASVCWGFRSRKELENAGAAHLFESPEALGDWILERGK